MKSIITTGAQVETDVLKLFGYEPIEQPPLKPLEDGWKEPEGIYYPDEEAEARHEHYLAQWAEDYGGSPSSL